MRRWHLLFLLAFLAGCTRQPEAPGVAKVNGETITAEQFRQRYRSYLDAVGGRDNILLRKKILDNMINEHLIAADVRRRGLDTDLTSRSAVEEIRTRQMLLGYAQRITLDTMKVSEEELTEEFRRYQTRVNARYLYAATEDSARRLKEALDRGSTFEALARKVFSDPGLAGNGGSLGYFGWGELDPEIERRGYALPVGEVSEPFRFENGYAILRVDNRVMKPLASETDYAKAKPELLQAIQKRKVLNGLNAATEQLKAELAPAVDTAVAPGAFAFWRSHGGAGSGAPPEPSAADAQLFGSTLLRFPGGGGWSVGEFFRKAAAASPKERARVRSLGTFRDFAVGLAVKEETMRRARAAGLESDSAVQAQAAAMTRDYLLRRWKQHVEDSVRGALLPEALLRQRYGEKRQEYVHPPEVNVAEILLRRKTEADSIARTARSGGNFASLAKARSIRLWAAARGGELGFAPQSAYGPLGEKFFAAAVGTIIGPEFVDPYYGVFKVAGRREARPMTFDEARGRIADELETPRIQDALKRALETLRGAASVSVDENILANVSLQ